MKRLARWFLVLTTILLIGWIGWTSPTLNECLSQQYENYSGNSFQEKIASFYVLLIGSRLCIGEFIHANGEGIIAIFTVILGIATWFLWKATRDLVNDAKATSTSQIAVTKIAAEAAKKSSDTLVATERPHVFIVVQLNNLQEMITGLSLIRADADSKASTDLKVSYFFENYGRTPAIIKESSHYLIHKAALPDEWHYVPIDTVETEPALRANDATNARDCPLDPLVPFTKHDVSEIVRGQRSLWFFGRVVYDDLIGGKDHEHRFLWRYNGGSHGFRPCYDYPNYIKNT
jgi:hypothetical protein